jgi:perosamine synthetase
MKVAMSSPTIGLRERLAVDRVLRSRMLAQGSQVAAFESEFSKIVGGRECVAVNSGTSALHLILLAHAIGPGDEVIVPSFTFAATANAVRLAGATPVFADVTLDTFCLDPESVRGLVSERTRCVIPVHLFGHPADLSELESEFQSRGILIIEDAAQAHLASLHGKTIGTLGDAAAFSFYPTKNMTSGEGGMVVTNNPEVARKVRLLRNQGMLIRYQNEIAGFNNRMTDIHAAIGRVQLSRLRRNTRLRIRNAKIYRQLLGDLAPVTSAGASHVYHQYTVKVPHEKRARIQDHLASRGISSDVYYPTPVHRLPAYDSPFHLPNTELLAKTVLSLPVHPKISKRRIRRISRALIEAINHEN